MLLELILLAAFSWLFPATLRGRCLAQGSFLLVLVANGILGEPSVDKKADQCSNAFTLVYAQFPNVGHRQKTRSPRQLITGWNSRKFEPIAEWHDPLLMSPFLPL